jgi:hypothetical protein
MIGSINLGHKPISNFKKNNGEGILTDEEGMSSVVQKIPTKQGFGFLITAHKVKKETQIEFPF